ncbi:hypothetical protein Tco_0353568 [Tanacetum coccineum]
MDKRKKHFAKLRAEENHKKTTNPANELKENQNVWKGSRKPSAERSKKRTRKELDEESVKRQKLEDDAEKAKLKLCLEIVPRDDEAMM